MLFPVSSELVLGRLDVLVKQFVIKVSLALGMSEYVARESGGKIFTFGLSFFHTRLLYLAKLQKRN